MAEQELKERDAMICRACGKEERASEGYPCVDCGTFVCTICSMRGVLRCARCAGAAGGSEGAGESSGAGAADPALGA